MQNLVGFNLINCRFTRYLAYQRLLYLYIHLTTVTLIYFTSPIWTFLPVFFLNYELHKLMTQLIFSLSVHILQARDVSGKKKSTKSIHDLLWKSNILKDEVQNMLTCVCISLTTPWSCQHQENTSLVLLHQQEKYSPFSWRLSFELYQNWMLKISTQIFVLPDTYMLPFSVLTSYGKFLLFSLWLLI